MLWPITPAPQQPVMFRGTDGDGGVDPHILPIGQAHPAATGPPGPRWSIAPSRLLDGKMQREQRFYLLPAHTRG